jgi:hypothetical protein
VRFTLETARASFDPAPFSRGIEWQGERWLRTVCDSLRNGKHGASAAILAAEGGTRDAAVDYGDKQWDG